MAITKVTVKHFRNHKFFTLDIDKDIVLLLGGNGTGKTSILEAISLLSPGKGMLSADVVSQNCNIKMLADSDIVMPVRDGDEDAKISADSADLRPYEIDILLDDLTDIRIFSKLQSNNRSSKSIAIRGKVTRKQLDLTHWCDVIWFSAKMQYDLLHSAQRRKLIDRLSFHCDCGHADLVKDYEKLIRSRLNMLENDRCDVTFIDALERQIAMLSVKIFQNRLKLLSKMNCISGGINSELPKIKFVMNGSFEEIVGDLFADEEMMNCICGKLKFNRERDKMINQTTFGVHKTKIDILDDRGVSFADLSSGQQKLLFLQMIGIFCSVVFDIKNRSPIVLLDEVVSFLDKDNIRILLGRLREMSAQIWMTTPIEIDTSEIDMQVINL